MIVNNLRVESDKENISIIADIKIERGKSSIYPDILWFRYPQKYAEYLTKSMNPFAASVFLLAGFLNEDLFIKGSLSPRLLWGMNEYLLTLHTWFPDVFNIVNISAENLIENNKNVPCKTATSFSGGVDSFYTLLRYLPGQCEVMPISYALFIHGFDIPLEDNRSYEIAKEKYTRMMNDLNVELIAVATNAKEFTRGMNWNNVFGTTIAGVVHSLEGLYQFYFLPSAQDYYTLAKEGTDPRLVPVLATEATAIILDAGNISRTEKTEFIANKSVTYEHLRVCWENVDGLNNCGHCEKCLRTMVELELSGQLSQYSTFQEPLTIEKIEHVNINKPVIEVIWIDILNKAKSKGRKDIARSIKLAKFEYRFRQFFNPDFIKKARKVGRKIGRRINRFLSGFRVKKVEK